MRNTPRGTAPAGPRRAAAGITAAVLALATPLLPGMAPAARAFTPATFDRALGTPDGPRPTITTSMSVSDTTVTPGQKITYTLQASMSAPVPGPSSGTSPGTSPITEFNFDFQTDPNAPLDRAPVASDFVWSDGVTRQLAGVTDLGGGQWSVGFYTPSPTDTGLGMSPSVTATLPATVSTSVSPGTTLNANSLAHTEILPAASWAQPDPVLTYDAPLSCTGTFTWDTTLRDGQYGQWLMDLHWGAMNGTGGTTGAIDFSNSAPVVRVTDRTGADITAQVMANATYDANDPTAPLIDAYPDAIYKQSLNFPFDTNSGTGNTWLTSGTTIHIEQAFINRDCQAGVYQSTQGVRINVNAANTPRMAEATAATTFDVVAPAAPAWAVRKATTDTPLALTGTSATTVTRNYTVTVTNTGAASGAAPDAIDTPAVPAGMTIQSAAVDGAAATISPDGTITIAGGQALAAGASANHAVVVTYAVNPATLTAAQWTALASCTTSAGQATSGPAAGLYNSVALPAGVTDTDGPNNNDVCTNATGSPAIQVVKSINGDDADTAPGAAVAPGETMNITYDITNTGNQPLTGVVVTDQVTAGGGTPPADIDCDPNTAGAQATLPGTLAPGGTAQCTATMTAPAADVQHTDVATVTGTPPANPDGSTPPAVTDDNPANALPVAPRVPAISIKKYINGDDAQSTPGVSVVEGSTMQIRYDVANTGGVTLNNVVVTDDKVAAADISCTPGTGNQVGTLAAGEKATCTATMTAPAAGVQHTNTGTVAGTPPGVDGVTPPPVTSSDPANALPTPVPAPGVAIVKYINGDDANTVPGVQLAAGSTMAISYLVTNTGNVPLTGVAVTDKVTAGGGTAPAVTCPQATLAANESMTCTATMPARPAGVQHSDEATVVGTPPANADGTPWTGPDGSTTVTDTNPANAIVPAAPGVGIVKYINGDDANTAPGVVVPAGSKLAITFRVKNTGNQPLSNVTVTDDKVAASAITCPAPATGNVIATLAVGQVVDCTATLAAPAAGGLHTDLGTVVGTPPTPPATPANPNPVPPTPVSDTDQANATVPAIQVVKKINGDDANTAPGVQVEAGSTMAITYEVTNTGLVPLSGVAVTDKVTQGGGTAPAVTCPQATLAPGATMTCTASMPAPKAGVQHADDATVVGTPPANPATPDNPTPAPPVPVTDHDPAHATSVAQPAAVTIVKKINGDDANTAPGVPVEAGSTMAITYLVTNTGTVALTDVTVTDDKVAAKAIECPKATLAVGESMTCTASLAAPKAGAQHTNTGTVTALPPAPADGSRPTPVTAHDPANAWTPSVRIVKAINGDDANTAPGVAVQPGSTMRITYLVTNTGRGDLAEVKVTDDKPVQGLKCPATTLAAGASMTCTATLAAPAAGGDHVDVGTVVGTPLLPPSSDGKRKPAPFTVTHHDEAHAHGTIGAPAKHVDGPGSPRIHIAGTGADVSPAALAAGVALVASGAGALLIARRRRDEE